MRPRILELRPGLALDNPRRGLAAIGGREDEDLIGIGLHVVVRALSCVDELESQPAPAFDFDQSGPEFNFDQSLPDPFEG